MEYSFLFICTTTLPTLVLPNTSREHGELILVGNSWYDLMHQNLFGIIIIIIILKIMYFQTPEIFFWNLMEGKQTHLRERSDNECQHCSFDNHLLMLFSSLDEIRFIGRCIFHLMSQRMLAHCKSKWSCYLHVEIYEEKKHYRKCALLSCVGEGHSFNMYMSFSFHIIIFLMEICTCFSLWIVTC